MMLPVGIPLAIQTHRLHSTATCRQQLLSSAESHARCCACFLIKMQCQPCQSGVSECTDLTAHKLNLRKAQTLEMQGVMKDSKSRCYLTLSPTSPKRLPVEADTENPNWIPPSVEKRVCPCESETGRVTRNTAIWTVDFPAPFPFCPSMHNQKLSDPPKEEAVS